MEFGELTELTTDAENVRELCEMNEAILQSISDYRGLSEAEPTSLMTDAGPRPGTSTDMTGIRTVRCCMCTEEYEWDESLLAHMVSIHCVVESRLQFLLQFCRSVSYKRKDQIISWPPGQIIANNRGQKRSLDIVDSVEGKRRGSSSQDQDGQECPQDLQLLQEARLQDHRDKEGQECPEDLQLLQEAWLPDHRDQEGQECPEDLQLLQEAARETQFRGQVRSEQLGSVGPINVQCPGSETSSIRSLSWPGSMTSSDESYTQGSGGNDGVESREFVLRDETKSGRSIWVQNPVRSRNGDRAFDQALNQLRSLPMGGRDSGRGQDEAEVNGEARAHGPGVAGRGSVGARGHVSARGRVSARGGLGGARGGRGGARGGRGGSQGSRGRGGEQGGRGSVGARGRVSARGGRVSARGGRGGARGVRSCARGGRGGEQGPGLTQDEAQGHDHHARDSDSVSVSSQLTSQSLLPYAGVEEVECEFVSGSDTT